MIIWGSVIVAVMVIVYGFYLAGSPFKQRMVRFDNQRIFDLQTVQSQIVYYWQQKDKLPQSLDDLRDSISGFVPPVDPDTSRPYDYKITGNLSFELCADFSLPSDSRLSATAPRVTPMDRFGENWEHNEGHVCFTRTIDPELYKTSKPFLE